MNAHTGGGREREKRRGRKGGREREGEKKAGREGGSGREILN